MPCSVTPFPSYFLLNIAVLSYAKLERFIEVL